MEMLKVTAGINMTYIPYKGGAPAIADLIARTDPVSDQRPAGRAAAHQQQAPESDRNHRGQSAQPGLPDTPTFAESGLARLRHLRMVRRVCARKNAERRADKFSREIARIVKLPDMSEKLSVQGAIPVGNSAAEFSAFVKHEMDIWGKVAQQVGLKPD